VLEGNLKLLSHEDRQSKTLLGEEFQTKKKDEEIEGWYLEKWIPSERVRQIKVIDQVASQSVSQAQRMGRREGGQKKILLARGGLPCASFGAVPGYPRYDTCLGQNPNQPAGQ